MPNLGRMAEYKAFAQKRFKVSSNVGNPHGTVSHLWLDEC